MAAKQAGNFLYVLVPTCAELLFLKVLPIHLSVGSQYKPTTKVIQVRIKMRRLVWITDHFSLLKITASFATQLLVKSNRAEAGAKSEPPLPKQHFMDGPIQSACKFNSLP